MELSNRILASFLLVFIISIIFGTQLTLKEVDKLTGLAPSESSPVSVTIANVCGDNNIGGSEICDGTDLDSQTCVTQGFDAGTLLCAANCQSFDTSQCFSSDSNTETEGGGAGNNDAERNKKIATALHPTYDADSLDSFDFAEKEAQFTTYIIFKKQTYVIHADEIGDDFAVLKFVFPVFYKEPLFLKFDFDQKRFLDLDGDGIVDFEFTLRDIIVKRAIFHVEKIKAGKTEIPYIVSFGIPKFEAPKIISDNQDFNKEILLLFVVVALALINFAFFKKFVYSK